MTQKEAPGAAWRSLGEPIGTLFDGFGDILAPPVPPWRALLAQTLTFVIFAPLCSKTTTFEDPTAQVGATWAQRRRPKGGQVGPKSP